MSYYTGAQGDYYRGAQGDIFKSIKKFVGKAAPYAAMAAPFIPGIGPALGAGINMVAGALGPKPAQMPGGVQPAMLAPTGKAGAIVRAGKAVLPYAAGAAAAYLLDSDGNPVRRRRTMNPTNVKALRRSLRRVESFKHLAKRACPDLCPPRRSAPRGARAACCK